MIFNPSKKPDDDPLLPYINIGSWVKQRIKEAIIPCVVFLFPTCLVAEENGLKEDLSYPQVSNTLDYIYDDYIDAYDRVFTKDAIPYWWLVGLSTVAMIAIDDKLLSEAERFGQRLNIASEDHTTTFVRIGGESVLRLPTDLGSWLYYIGDGWTHAGIAASFLMAGSWQDDDRAYNTGFQLVEGMITTTIAIQTLKHITGRESPFKATQPTGKWDWFPNQVEYAQNVSSFDAFPSGHLAVGTMTLTVIAKNYPEKTWIMPLGVTLLSLLSFQMMNNGVHWASDYPLAIALGYTFGSIAYERGQRLSQSSVSEQSRMRVLPIINKNNLGIAVNYSF
ncbi:MAG: phosphatase PAP2 family protein [Mariprofundaceae bacterium]